MLSHVAVLAGQSKTMDFTSVASVSGMFGSTPFQTTFNLTGVQNFTSPIQATSGSFSGAAPGGDPTLNGTFTWQSAFGSDTQGTVSANNMTLHSNQFGDVSFPAQGIFRASDFNLSFSWNTQVLGQPFSGNASGILQPTHTDPVNVTTTATWDGNHTDMEFSFDVSGPVLHTPAFLTPLTTLQLFWASGPATSQIIGTSLSDPVNIFWNDASENVQVTGLTPAPSGANYLLIVEGPRTLDKVVGALDMAGSHIGLYVPNLASPNTSSFFLSKNNAATNLDVVSLTVNATGPGWIPLVGDWNGTGKDTVGLYDPAHGQFHLYGSNNSPPSSSNDFGFANIPSNFVPLAGHWSGPGMDTIGLYDPVNAHFYLADKNSANLQLTDVNSFGFEGLVPSGWIPLVGDWTGSGKDTIGLYDPADGLFILADANTNNLQQLHVNTFAFPGVPSDWRPVVGDWSGDGSDKVGLYDPTDATFFLVGSNSAAPSSVMIFGFGQGISSWLPLVGNWQIPTPSAAPQGLQASSSARVASPATSSLGSQAIAGLANVGLAADPKKTQPASYSVAGNTWLDPGPEAPVGTVVVDGNAVRIDPIPEPVASEPPQLSTAEPERDSGSLDPHAVDQLDLPAVASHAMERLYMG